MIELPFAHGRLDWGARRRVAADLRGRFDAAYVLPNSLKSALIPWLAGIPKRIGYRAKAASRRSTTGCRTDRATADGRFVRRWPANRHARGNGHGCHWRRLFGQGDDRRGSPARRVLGLRARCRVRPGQVRPAGRYAELARSLHRQHGQRVLLLGSAREAALCEQVAAQSDGACRVLAGKTSLQDAMALIAGRAASSATIRG